MSVPVFTRTTALIEQIDAGMHTFAVRHSVSVLRVALAFVFILFGALKFFPDLSPAQDVATAVMTKLTFGLVPAGPALLAVAIAEVGVGLCLIANRFMRVAVWFLAFEMFAILSPIVLLPGELFSGPHHLPSLLGQYILKDFVLLGGVLVLFATQRGARIADVDDITGATEASSAMQSAFTPRQDHSLVGAAARADRPDWQQPTWNRPPRRRGVVAQAAMSPSSGARSSSSPTVRS
ncbi:MAG: DoxX family protein [Solirubrobacteraceae bacterium]|nr:DoxX family protein [Solirubrobacteraceae bacterium]